MQKGQVIDGCSFRTLRHTRADLTRLFYLGLLDGTQVTDRYVQFCLVDQTISADEVDLVIFCSRFTECGPF